MPEKMIFNATVIYLINSRDEILLARKTQKIGVGFLNGYGGGIEEGETPEESACRELAEECGAIAQEKDLEKVGIVDFHNTKEDGSQFVAHCHIYFVRNWSGEPKETAEMAAPAWFPVNDIPYEKLMPADRIWLPYVLAGKKVRAHAHYGPFQKELLQEVFVEEI